MKKWVMILVCALSVGCGGSTVPDKPSAEASANQANRQRREQSEYMQRRAEYDRQHPKGIQRGAGLPQPPPPDPANTQPFVPPAMDIKGTPTALQAPDVQATIEKIYEDSDYAYLTRNVEGSVKIYADKVNWDGDTMNRDQMRKFFKEDFASVTDLEARVGQSLRSGSKSEILKVTPKGSNKVVAQVRCTQRLMASAVNYQDVFITESREVLVLEKGQWRISEIKTTREEHHTYRDGQEITE
jgi:hypothetical protein